MKVLLVDDDPGLRDLLSEILKVKGFETVPVETGAAALARIESPDIDVALIDLKLEDMSGLDVLRGIKQYSPDTECILLTGYASRDSAIEAINLGAYAYFQKPYDVEQLLVVIRRAGEKRAAEEALQNNEKRLRTLIENGRDNISLLAADGTLLWESPSTDSTLGYAPNQFVGRNIFELMHPDDQVWTRDLFEQIAQTPGRSQVGVFRLRHSNGTWRWIESTTSNMLNEPSVRAIVINYRDITEHKQAVETLRESEERYREIFNGVQDAIMVETLDGRILAVNERACEMYGYSHAEFLTKTVADLVPEDQKILTSTTEEISASPLETENLRSNGRRFPIEISGRLQTINGEKLLLVIIRDVTERKRHERELEAEAMLALALSETLALQPLLEILLTAARHAIPSAEKGSLALMADEEHLQVRAISGYQESGVLGYTYPITWGFAGRVVRERQPVLVMNVQADAGLQADARDATIGEVHDLHSAIAVPLLVQDTIIGVLSLESASPGVFDENDLRLLSQFSVSAALIIERARLFDVSHQQAGKIAAVNALGRALAATLDLSTIYRTAYQHIQTLLDCNNFAISLFEDASDTLKADFILSDGLEFDAHLIPPLLFDRQGPRAGRAAAILDARTVILNDMAEKARQAGRVLVGSEEEPQSAAYTPMLVDDKVIGLLELQSYRNHAYQESDLDLLNMIANQIGLAIQNARLYQEVQHKLAERKQADESLRLSEEKYRALVDEINDGFYVTDGAGIFTFANPALARMYGLDSPEALVGRKFTDFVMPGMQAELGQAYGGAMQGGHAPEIVNGQIVRPDGMRAFVEIKSVAVVEAGQIAGSRGVIRDVTKRKHDEEALLENEKKVKHLLEQQIAINQLALALGESLNLKDVYHTICERLRGLVDVWCFIVSSYDEQAREICAEYVESEEIYDVSGFPRIPLGEPGQGTQSQVIHTGRPLYTPDHQKAISKSKVRYTIENDGSVHEELPSEQEQENTTRSVVYLPMKIEGKTVGIMQVQSTRLDAYSEEDITLLAGMANVAAVAAQNARLFQEVQHELEERRQAEKTLLERLAELELLYQSGLALGQLLSPKEIGQKIIELLEQKLDWHHTTIRLYHPQNETIELLAFNQPNLNNEKERRETEELFKNQVSRPGEGISGWAIQNSQIVRSADVSHDPRYVETYPGLHSGLYVPMILGNRSIGVISIESEQPNAFSEANERLVATLASQAASALENARLFEETRQRMAELETVNRISVALRVISSPDEMLAVVLEETLSALKTSNGSINLLNDATGQLHKSMARGWLSEFSEAPIEPGKGIFGTVFANGMAHVSREFVSDPLTRPEARGRLPSGWGGVCVPIRSAHKMLGVMLVSIPTEREFDKNEIRLLNTLAEMTGNALYRMKLYEETTRRAEEFASLYETNAAISGKHDLDTLMQTIVKSATELLKATAGGLYFCEPFNEELEVVVSTHASIRVGTRLRFGEGMAGRVAQTRQPLRVEDHSTWEGRSEKYQTGQIRAVLEVPILFGGELIGVLALFEVGASERTYTESDEHMLSLFAAQAAGVIRSARLHEETQHRLKNLQALREVDRVITSSFDLHPILGTVINHTVMQLGVDAAALLIFNPTLQTLQYATGYGFYTRNIEQTNARLGEGHAGSAALTRRVVHVPNLHEAGPQFMRASLLAGENFLEYYGVPLISKGEIKGVLEVFQRSPLHPKPEWLEMLETLAEQAAIAIDNSQLFENIQRSNMELGRAYEATIEGWSRAMDLRDKETEGHTQRVTKMATDLAEAFGLNDQEILHIRRGALLHDIGKMGVPDHILLKPGKLVDMEWALMQQHPQFAYDMLQPIHYLRDSLDIPYCHHEKWDGTGYPQGLKGEQIPLAARIFALVDVYDALTSDRPYRRAWPKAKTLQYILEQSGTHFDPQVVEKFLQLFGAGKTRKVSEKSVLPDTKAQKLTPALGDGAREDTKGKKFLT